MGANEEGVKCLARKSTASLNLANEEGVKCLARKSTASLNLAVEQGVKIARKAATSEPKECPQLREEMRKDFKTHGDSNTINYETFKTQVWKSTFNKTAEADGAKNA